MMPSRSSTDNTLPADKLSSFQAALEEALRSHEERLEGESELDDISIAIRRRSQEARAEITAALSRIRDGSFGTCVKCLTDISPDRLDAMPHARHCLNCAS